MLQKLNNQGYTFTDNGRVIVVDKYGAVKRLTNLSLTTIGTTGPATLIGNVLNIPDYTETYFGTVTSVGLTMPAAFSVANSPITTAGTINVTAAGLVSQYIRGDGTLADFPGSTGGGSSVAYYLNGSINQGTFGGTTYYQMSRTPVTGTGTNFSIAANGYIASFITDVADPSLISIPPGGWSIQFYMNADSAGGSPSFYVELYKYDGVSFTLISSGSASPEAITGGASVDLYYTSISVPTTALTVTDRLAVRVYVNNSGKTITFRTEGTNLAEIVTTFTTGLTALNGLTAQVQYFTTGTSGTDFTISSALATHTFNLPVASALNTGKLSNTDWVTFNAKQDALSLTTTGSSGASTLIGSTLNVPAYTLSGLGGVPTSRTLTVNGTSYDLSADRSWSVGTVTSVAATAGTGISISGSPITGSGTLTITNTAPDQTVALTAGTGIGVAGTYPNFTITNTSPSSGGTVTSVAALTLGTTGTDLSSTVANSTTTPVITLNVPTASALNRGALSSADWSTFNAKQNAITLTTTGNSGSSTLVGSTLNVPTYTLSGLGGVSGSGTTNYVPKWTGSTALGNSLIFDNGTNVGIGTTSPSAILDVNASNGEIRSTGTSTNYTQYNAFITSGVNMRIGAFATNNGYLGTTTNHPFTIETNNTQRARFFANGNLLIGSGTTDGGYRLDVSGTARVRESLFLLRSDAAATVEALKYTTANTIDLGNTFRVIGTNRWQNTVSSTSYIENGYTTKTFVTTNPVNGNFSSYDFSASNAYQPGIANPYTQKLINGAMTINSTAATNSFHGISISTTDNSASIANNIFAVYADATLGTNTSANRWAGYFLGRGYFSGNVGIGNNSIGGINAASVRLDVRGTTWFSADAYGQLEIIPTTGNGGETVIRQYTTPPRNGGDLRIRVDAAVQGGNFIIATNANNERMRVTSSGNVLIGTTTDAGFRLDINGTARVQGATTISTGRLTISNAGNDFYPLYIGSSSVSNSRIYLESSGLQEIVASGGPGLRFQSGSLRIDGTNNTTNKVFISTANGVSQHVVFWLNAGETEIGGTGGVLPTSAMLSVTSTTKGFLPPRMTTTQKNAITSPAAGLIVYDTTLNKLCVYTTAWETITSV
jgi:hypothetical protein